MRGSKRQRLPVEALAPYLLELPDPPVPFDWSRVFGNDHPVELEVGFGKGLFLLTAGQANPRVNHVGVEVDRGLQLFTANRIAKRGLANVRLAKADARLFLRDYVADRSLAAVHVYFPDPWWKKRHKKRRVFTEDFARQCERVLRPGGKLLIASDVEEYFQTMRTIVARHAPELRPIPAAPKSDAGTNFERKARLQGRSVHRAAFEARSSEAPSG